MTTSHIVLAPDSFKGSASALTVAEAIGAGLRQTLPDARLTIAPMADGGEGTLDCVAAARDGRFERATLTAIHDAPIAARWYRTDDASAVIESAEVLGLPLIEAQPAPAPLAARGSHALGDLIATVLDAGIHDLVIGLGGSACNDCGLGMLIALGARATDAHGTPVTPSMNGLLSLARIDMRGLDPRLADRRIRILCDVDNPLLGAEGASRIYGPQKGLTPHAIDAVERAFAHLAEQTGARHLVERTGSGAAGGLGFALALAGGELLAGADTLLDLTGLRSTFRQADLVITGEGRSDRQTLAGKLPLAVARAAAPTPTWLVSGDIAADARDALETHFACCHTLVEHAGDVAAAQADPRRWLAAVGTTIGETMSRERPANDSV